MIDTGDKNFNLNLNINIKNIRTRYQYQYQYCRIQNSISISIPIPKMIKFKLNLKTIPRYLDILRSQANTQKIRASIAQLWFRDYRAPQQQQRGIAANSAGLPSKSRVISLTRI